MPVVNSQTYAIKNNSHVGFQTEEIDSCDQVETIIHSCPDDIILEYIDALYTKIPEEEKIVYLFAFFEDLQSQSQVKYFEVLGKMFN